MAKRATRPKPPRGAKTSTRPDIHDDLKEQTFPRLFDPGESMHALKIADRFVLPPFTQLDAKQGLWQDRKRMWLDLGLRSQVGRTARTFGGDADRGDDADDVTKKILALTNGQSIFDPVLCELAYRWFTGKGDMILDPFAGGSVRGIVASVTERRYTGIDLSDIQVQANMLQSKDFVDRMVYPAGAEPWWLTGDSREVLLEPDEWDLPELVDFVWSCPPYHDLEKYSKDPRDLSNMPWGDFLTVYREIIACAVRQLATNRFAGFVVGEIRDKDGCYRNFVGETIRAFEDAGCRYYNEAILVSPAGTLPLRVAKQFVASRKMGRNHQTILFFVKGDPKVATERIMDHATMEAAVKAMGGHSLDDVLAAQGDDDDYTPGWEN